MTRSPDETDRLDRLELAHALRTPLTSALLATGILEDEALGALNDAQREVVASIVADLSRIGRLVDDGLQTAALGAYAGPIERHRVSLASLAAEAIEPLVRQSRARRVRLELAIEEAAALVDPIKLRWVIASLVGNAIRYAQRRVALTLRSDGATATLSVLDDGPGIDPAVAARVFERDGPGPTLYLVREIVEAHGGRIAVLGGEVGGTRFDVRLPIAPASGGHGGGEHEQQR